MHRWVVPTLAQLAACLAFIPVSLYAEEAQGLTLNPSAPPVYGLDDFNVLDDRLWTAAVSRRPQLIQTAPASVEVLSGDDLRIPRPPTGLIACAMLPGLTYIRVATISSTLACAATMGLPTSV